MRNGGWDGLTLSFIQDYECKDRYRNNCSENSYRAKKVFEKQIFGLRNKVKVP